MQRDLNNALSDLSPDIKSEREKDYIPHITLGRLKQWEFRAIEPEERPEVNEEIDLSFEVSFIDIMESRLKRGGAEYAILESIPLFR